jgi:hypothetical protein
MPKSTGLRHEGPPDIEKLLEYRQSLISATVTGKIDVRNWLSSSACRESLSMPPEVRQGEGVRADDGEHLLANGLSKAIPATSTRDAALDTKVFFQFIEASQPKAWEKIQRSTDRKWKAKSSSAS